MAASPGNVPASDVDALAAALAEAKRQIADLERARENDRKEEAERVRRLRDAESLAQQSKIEREFLERDMAQMDSRLKQAAGDLKRERQRAVDNTKELQSVAQQRDALLRSRSAVEDEGRKRDQQMELMRRELEVTEIEAKARRKRQIRRDIDNCQRQCWEERRREEATEREERSRLQDKKRGAQLDAVRMVSERLQVNKNFNAHPQRMGMMEVYASLECSSLATALEVPLGCTWRELRRAVNHSAAFGGLGDDYTFVGLEGSGPGKQAEKAKLQFPFVPLRTEPGPVIDPLKRYYRLDRINTFQDDNYEQWKRKGKSLRPYGFTMPWVQLRRAPERRWCDIRQSFYDATGEDPQEALRHRGRSFYPDEVDYLGRGYLHEAVAFGSDKVVRQLVGAGCSILLRDSQGATAGHLAASLGHESLLAPMLESKKEAAALLAATDGQQRTLLHCASLDSSRTVVRLLLARGAEMDVYDRYSRTPFHCAVSAGDAATVRCFLDCGVKVKTGGDDIMQFRSHRATLPRPRSELWAWTAEPMAQSAGAVTRGESVAKDMLRALASAGVDLSAPFGALRGRSTSLEMTAPSVWSLSRKPRLHNDGGLVGAPPSGLAVGHRTLAAAVVRNQNTALLQTLLELKVPTDVWLEGWVGCDFRFADGRPVHLIEAAAAGGWAEGVKLLGEAMPGAVNRREPLGADRPETVMVIHYALLSRDPGTVAAALLLSGGFTGWTPGGLDFIRPTGHVPVPHNAVAAAIAAGDLDALEALLETSPDLAEAPCLGMAVGRRSALVASPLWYAAYAGAFEFVDFLAENTRALDAAGDAMPGLWLVTPHETNQLADFTDGVTCVDKCPFLAPDSERRPVSSCLGAGLAPGSDLLGLPSPMGNPGGWDVHWGRVECTRTLLVHAQRPHAAGRAVLDFCSCGFSTQRSYGAQHKHTEARAHVWGGQTMAPRPSGLYTTLALAVRSGDANLAVLTALSLKGRQNDANFTFGSEVIMPNQSPDAAALRDWVDVTPAPRGDLLCKWLRRIGTDDGESMRGWKTILGTDYVRWLAGEPTEVVRVATLCCKMTMPGALRALLDALVSAGASTVTSQTVTECFPLALRSGNTTLLSGVVPHLERGGIGHLNRPAVLEALAAWPALGGSDGPKVFVQAMSQDETTERSLHDRTETIATAAARHGSPVLRLVVERWPISINATNAAGQGPLHLSCAFGHVQDALWLLRSGADVLREDSCPPLVRGEPSAAENEAICEGRCSRRRRAALYSRGFYPKSCDIGLPSLCKAALSACRDARREWRAEHAQLGFGPLRYFTPICARRLQCCVSAGGGTVGSAMVNGLFVHNQPAFRAGCAERLRMHPNIARGGSLDAWTPESAADETQEELRSDSHFTGSRLPSEWLRVAAECSLPAELSTLARAAALSSQPAVTNASGGSTDVSAAVPVLPGQKGVASFYASLVPKPKKALMRLLSRYGGALDELDFAGDCPGVKTLHVLFTELLSRLPRLARLGLRSCQVTNKEVDELCAAASSHPSLTQIDLSMNPDIFLEGGRALQALLRKNTNILTLDVKGTGLSEATQEALESACRGNKEAQEALQVSAP
eukprot:Hpha_TRINITY_DN2383_c0_g1::TRINITY_DN2383_c0_g1_i1::g.310::m.310